MPDATAPAAESLQTAVAAAVEGAPEPALAAKTTVFERLEAAKAEALKSDGAPAVAKPDAHAADPAKLAPTEPEKRAARGLAEIAEREAALVETQRATKAERAAIDADRKAFETQNASFLKAQTLVKGGDHLGALAALGIDLEKAQDQYLANLRDPSPDELARKAAREEWDRIRKDEDDKKKADEDAKLKEHETKLVAARGAYMDEAEQAFAKNKDEFDFIAAYEVSATHVLERAIQMERTTGKTPDPLEAMRAIERDLAEKAAKTKKFGAAAKPAGDTQETAEARDTTPRTLTSRSPGGVPLTSKPARKSTVQERLAEAKREAGVS
jgi:hypothetical protein